MIDLIPGIQASSAALEAERTRLDVIAQNIANVHTTHAADGKPYQRQEVVFETALSHAVNGQPQEVIPRVARIEKDSRPPISVYMPGNPDADAHGMVAMPNINIHEEMADLIVASRTYEANLAVVKSARMMAVAALSIGKK